MSDNFLCGARDCGNFIPPHLRRIFCFHCKVYFHSKCCGVTRKMFDNLTVSGENWFCLKCRPKEPKVHCGSCRKTIDKTILSFTVLRVMIIFTQNALKYLLTIFTAPNHGSALLAFQKIFPLPIWMTKISKSLFTRKMFPSVIIFHFFQVLTFDL